LGGSVTKCILFIMAVLSTTSTTYLTNIANVLKKVIAPAIQEVLPQETIWFDMLKTNSGVTPMANNTFYISIRSGRHSGIASVAEGATLPSGKPSWSQANVTAKYVFGTFDITDQVIESAKSSVGSLVNYLMENTKSLKVDFARELNRIFWGAGDEVIAKVHNDDAHTGTTLTVAPILYPAINSDIPATKYLSAGMKILIGSDVDTIVSVDSDTQVTLTTGASRTDGENIKKADGDDAAVDEPMGIDGLLVSSGTIQGIDTAASPWFTPAQIETTAEALSEAKMIAAYVKAREFGDPKFVFMNAGLWKKYGTLLTSLKKTSDLKEVLSGGWKGLDFMGGNASVVLDYDCPDGKVFFIDPDSLTLAQLTPISFIDRGDGLLRRVNYAAWQGVLRWYGNLCIKNPKANAKLTAKTAV
jgi:hypothetical protein